MDEEHDEATCECSSRLQDQQQLPGEDHLENPPRRSSAHGDCPRGQDEMDCAGAHRLLGYVLRNGDRELKEGVDGASLAEQLASSMFGTLPINAFACLDKCPCDTHDDAHSLHSSHSLAHMGAADRICLRADTHREPQSFKTSSPLPQTKTKGSLDMNNNSNRRMRNNRGREARTGSHETFDEILEFPLGNNSLTTNAIDDDDEGDGLSVLERVTRMDRSLNGSSSSRSDDRIMVLFKILDFIF